jgi:hypothetical protein
VLRGGAEFDPLVAKAGRDAGLDHLLHHLVLRLVAHPVEQVAARAHLLECGEVATLVMHASETVPNELL